MKKYLLTLLMLLTLSLGLKAQVITDNISRSDSFTGKGYATGATDTSKAVSLTSTDSQVKYNLVGATNTSAFQLNATNKSGFYTSENPQNLEIISIKLTFKENSSKGVDLYAGTTAYTVHGTTTGTKIETVNNTKEIDLSGKGYTYFSINGNGGAAYITNVTVTYSTGGDVKIPLQSGLALMQDGNDIAETTLSFTEGEEHILDLLQNPNDISLEEMTFTSTNPEVAEMEDGMLLVYGVAGTAEITLSFPGNDDYLATEITFTVKVLSADEAKYIEEKLTGNSFNSSTGGSYSTKDYTSATTNIGYKANLINDGGNIQLNNASTSGVYSTLNPDNLEIVEITINYASKTNTARTLTVYANDKAYSEFSSAPAGTLLGTVKATDSSHTFDVSGKGYKYFYIKPGGSALYLTSVVVKYAEGAPVAPEVAFEKEQYSFMLSNKTHDVACTVPAISIDGVDMVYSLANAEGTNINDDALLELNDGNLDFILTEAGEYTLSAFAPLSSLNPAFEDVTATTKIVVSEPAPLALTFKLNTTELTDLEGEIAATSGDILYINANYSSVYITVTDEEGTEADYMADGFKLDKSGLHTYTIYGINDDDSEATYTLTINVAVKKGAKENPFTVADIKAGKASGKVWVRGYIVGYATSGTAFTSDNSKTNNSNIALADAPDDTAFIPVQLTGNFQTTLGVKANPAYVGEEIMIYGSAETYFSTNGIKSTSDYEWIVDPATKVLVTAGPEHLQFGGDYVIENGTLQSDDTSVTFQFTEVANHKFFYHIRTWDDTPEGERFNKPARAAEYDPSIADAEFTEYTPGETIELTTDHNHLQFYTQNTVTGEKSETNHVTVALGGLPTGVDAIGADDAETQIYTIQGVRVDEAKLPGLYIINGKKVIIR